MAQRKGLIGNIRHKREKILLIAIKDFLKIMFFFLSSTWSLILEMPKLYLASQLYIPLCPFNIENTSAL